MTTDDEIVVEPCAGFGCGAVGRTYMVMSSLSNPRLGVIIIVTLLVGKTSYLICCSACRPGGCAWCFKLDGAWCVNDGVRELIRTNERLNPNLNPDAYRVHVHVNVCAPYHILTYCLVITRFKH